MKALDVSVAAFEFVISLAFFATFSRNGDERRQLFIASSAPSIRVAAREAIRFQSDNFAALALRK